MPSLTPPAETVPYGDHPDQWIRIRRPASASRGVVAVIHGGFWKVAYGAEYAEPLSIDLAQRGWTSVTLEYRRVGGGGGFPATLDDVAAGLDALAVTDLDLATLAVVGHSAGGHLAAWSASRTRLSRWSGGVEVTHVVSQAGVLDLAAAVRDGLGSDAAARFLGSEPGAIDLADPTVHLPLDVPLWALHARDDDEVPFSQSQEYVSRARASGARAELVEVTGGHYGLIDVSSPAWAATLAVLEGIAQT